MINAVQMVWKEHGTRVQSAVGLWVVSRLLNLIEWRFRMEALM